MELSFGEQIKILLSRKNMTIQELADLYEQATGSKMSRQNLAQRLKRDNFPEQDMRTFARLLGCNVSIQLIPAAGTTAYPDPALTVPTDIPRSSFPVPDGSADMAWNAFPEPDGSIGMARSAFQEPDGSIDTARSAFQEPDGSIDTAHSAFQEPDGSIDTARSAFQEPDESIRMACSAFPGSAAARDMTRHPLPTPGTVGSPSSTDNEESSGMVFEIPEIFRKKKPLGDINPLTGQEYLTNTIRRHPYIDDYIQVYDRTTHSWCDVEEDYFWEFQKNKRQMLGSDYQEPIRI